MVAGDIVNAAARQHRAQGGAKQQMQQKSILDMKAIQEQINHLHLPTFDECSNVVRSASGSVTECYTKSMDVIKPAAGSALKYVQENPGQTVLYFTLSAMSSGFIACFLFCLTVYACIIGAIAVGVIAVLAATLSIALIATWAMLFVTVSAAMCVYVPVLIYRAIRVGLVTESYDRAKVFITEDAVNLAGKGRDYVKGITKIK